MNQQDSAEVHQGCTEQYTRAVELSLSLAFVSVSLVRAGYWRLILVRLVGRVASTTDAADVD